MTPAEREGLAELYESQWPPFDLAAIETELASLVGQHGDAITVADLGQLERAAA